MLVKAMHSARHPKDWIVLCTRQDDSKARDFLHSVQRLSSWEFPPQQGAGIFDRPFPKECYGIRCASVGHSWTDCTYSRIDYGCVAYGSACKSTLQKLDPVHHMALRICSGAFRTSPVQSLYVNCHQLPLDLRRRKLSLAYYFKILSVPSHPLQNVYMSTSMKRLL
ncbi:RNase H domain-containing protein [Trichonephila clavipes]|nr:RNase H domain-containing protein [Trichonephila clavipes]